MPGEQTPARTARRSLHPIRDDLVSIENWRTAEAVMAEEGAGTNRPTLRALKIISGDKHLLAIQKGRINECSIGRRGTGGETVERVFVFQLRVRDGGKLSFQSARWRHGKKATVADPRAEAAQVFPSARCY